MRNTCRVTHYDWLESLNREENSQLCLYDKEGKILLSIARTLQDDSCYGVRNDPVASPEIYYALETNPRHELYAIVTISVLPGWRTIQLTMSIIIIAGLSANFGRPSVAHERAMSF